MGEPIGYVDILETRVPIPPDPGARARAWAGHLLSAPASTDLAHLVQAIMDEERRNCLLLVESTIVNQFP